MSPKFLFFQSDFRIAGLSSITSVFACLPFGQKLLSWGIILLAVFPLIALQGCTEMNLGSSLAMPSLSKMAFKSDEADEFDEFEMDEGPEEVDPPFLGQYVTVSGLNMILLEGVGLVTGLDGTGGDPPPSQYRTALLKDMQRRDIPNRNSIIRSPSTALVIVRAYLPPLVQPGDRFDVEVRLPEGSETTSLNGGWLLECRLSERAVVAGRGVIDGKERARASGPILVSLGEGKSSSLLQRGRVIGGGVGLESRDMRLYMKEDVRSVRNATRIASRIGTRFFSYDSYGHREPLAAAKSDKRITLKIHPAYKDNFPRYVQVIQNIAFRESEVEQQVRMERLEEELMIPEKAELAAIQLEAIGPEAIPSLKKGLKAETLESRFHAAVALAYLGETAGLEVLYEAARDEPAFRVFAMAAMSTLDDGETHYYFSQLMNEELMEVRYGAFRGLTTVNKNDPLVRGETLNGQCKLHVIDVPGEPMIHLTHHQKAEIVLFGSKQEFKVPIAVAAGPHIRINAPAGSDNIIVSRYKVGEKDQRRVVSREIAEVIRAAADLGASYPDLAQMLVQAERQRNLPGQIGIDMLPEAGRVYIRPGGDSDGKRSAGRAKKIGNKNMVPNQYRKIEEDDKEALKPLLSSETSHQESSAEKSIESSKKGKPETEKLRKENSPEKSILFRPKSKSKSNQESDSNRKKEDSSPRIQPEKDRRPLYRKFNPIKKAAALLTPKREGELLYPETEPPPQQ